MDLNSTHLDRASTDPTPLSKSLPPEKAEQVEALGVLPVTAEKPARGCMRIDLHCHTEASPDSSTPLDLIPARCKERNIQVQAITDHNVIWGAVKLKRILSELGWGESVLTIIVGEEISTRQGELIGLFLQEPIEAGLSPEETIRRIKAQGGLVLLPHGFDPLKRFRLQFSAVNRLASSIDIVESFNCRISRPHWNHAAVTWARMHNLLMSAGSDAHTLADVGSAWVEASSAPIQTPQDLLLALKDGIPEGRWTHPAIAYLHKLWSRTLNVFTQSFH